jgi:hypothetical protein
MARVIQEAKLYAGACLVVRDTPGGPMWPASDAGNELREAVGVWKREPTYWNC